MPVGSGGGINQETKMAARRNYRHLQSHGKIGDNSPYRKRLCFFPHTLKNRCHR